MAQLFLAQGRLQAAGMAEARRLVGRATRRTFTRSQVRCPVDTGLLRSSGKFNVSGAGAVARGRVEYTADYAAAVHNGRKALTIKPSRPGGRLRFVVDGRTVYAREVHQPARPARPFLTDALREVGGQEGFTVTTRV